VSPRGTISFIAEGRIKSGGTKRITIGKHPTVSLEHARSKAQESLQLMKDGLDPMQVRAEEREQRAREAAAEDAKKVTLRTVFSDYQDLRDLKPKTSYDYRSTFNVCLADWLDKPIPSITRRMVEQRFLKIKNGRGKPQAAKCMRILSSVMNFAKAEEVEDGVRLITANPCEVLNDKKIDRQLKPRTRHLDKNELKLVVEELSHVGNPSASLSNQTIANFLMLLLFTGLRRDEAATLEWTDVDFERQYFTIHDTKNGTDHVVPMSSHVEGMLERRSQASDKHEQWVFPNRRKTGPLKEPRKQLEKLEQITGVKFTCHDLRRTFATLADSYGIDYYLIKRALNHKTQDITEQYIQSRVDRMRDVFDSVAKEIMWWAYDEGSPVVAEDEEAGQAAEDDNDF
jgi:integrase